MEIEAFIKLITGEPAETMKSNLKELFKIIRNDDEFTNSTSYKIITEIFSRGSCGRFAVILKNVFKDYIILSIFKRKLIFKAILAGFIIFTYHFQFFSG